jgi:HEAT repeat protein
LVFALPLEERKERAGSHGPLSRHHSKMPLGRLKQGLILPAGMFDLRTLSQIQVEHMMTDVSGRNADDLVGALADNDAAKRKSAREALVEIGASAVPSLLKTLDGAEQHVRWEIVKALTSIAEPSTAEPLVEALGDDDSDVRWVVGEALIALGHCAVKPLLTALAKSQDSEGYYPASHHVLHDLSKSAELAPLLAPVLAALGHSEPQVGVPVAAEDALAKLTAS